MNAAERAMILERAVHISETREDIAEFITLCTQMDNEHLKPLYNDPLCRALHTLECTYHMEKALEIICSPEYQRRHAV